jgi:hypothetical protein
MRCLIRGHSYNYDPPVWIVPPLAREHAVAPRAVCEVDDFTHTRQVQGAYTTKDLYLFAIFVAAHNLQTISTPSGS